MRLLHLVVLMAHFIHHSPLKLGPLPRYPLFVHDAIIHLIEKSINPEIILDTSLFLTPLSNPFHLFYNYLFFFLSTETILV